LQAARLSYRSGDSAGAPLIAGALAALAAFYAPQLAAQQSAPTPGTIQDSLGVRRPEFPSAPPQVVFPREGERVQQDRYGGRFLVHGFRIAGNTVFNEARLKRLLERFLDLHLNLYDLNKAADAITRFYQDNGYPVARAVIPAQRVENGVVRIEVVEGSISSVVFEGNERYSKDFLAARTGALSVGNLATLVDLERSMLLLNDLPGLRARSTLQPGPEFGTTDAIISIEEKPAAATLSLNNYGRRDAGEWRADVGGELNNPLGIGDQLSAKLIRAQDGSTEARRFAYNLPLSSNGLRLGASQTTVDYRVGGGFAALDIRGSVKNTDMMLTYPWQRSRTRNVYVGGGVRRTETRQTALGTPVSASRLNVFTAFIAGNWVHPDSSATNLSAQFTGNLKDNPGTGANAERMRQKIDLDFNHLAGVSNHWDLFTRLNVVEAGGAMPDTEKMSLGGPDSVRGYGPAELRGDEGWLATAELRRAFNVGSLFGVGTLFLDRGGVRSRGFAGQDKLASAGAGVSVMPWRDTRIRLEWARPTTRRTPSDGKDGGRVWLSISLSF
jgi:hemolysin activation/secretion protein